MSFTTNAHIRQFATNVDNLWTGSLKTKLLDYLLRVVLRVKLAPTREKKNKARIIELAARKKEEIQKKGCQKSGKPDVQNSLEVKDSLSD